MPNHAVVTQRGGSGHSPGGDGGRRIFGPGCWKCCGPTKSGKLGKFPSGKADTKAFGEAIRFVGWRRHHYKGVPKHSTTPRAQGDIESSGQTEPEVTFTSCSQRDSPNSLLKGVSRPLCHHSPHPACPFAEAALVGAGAGADPGQGAGSCCGNAGLGAAPHAPDPEQAAQESNPSVVPPHHAPHMSPAHRSLSTTNCCSPVARQAPGTILSFPVPPGWGVRMFS